MIPAYFHGAEGGFMKAGSIRFGALLLLVILIFSGCATDEEKKLSHLKKGQAYFENGKYREARIEFKNAIQIDPRYLEANIQLAETEVRLGDAGSAYRVYLRVAELDPDNLEAQLALAKFLLLGKNHAEAGEKIDAVLQKEPQNIEALLLLAVLNELENKPQECDSVTARGYRTGPPQQTGLQRPRPAVGTSGKNPGSGNGIATGRGGNWRRRRAAGGSGDGLRRQ